MKSLLAALIYLTKRQKLSASLLISSYSIDPIQAS